VIDFGSAVFADENHPKIISTRHYRAPEILLQIGWDWSCDIWSVGCIFVELLIGHTLFKTHEDLEHLAMIQRLIGPLPEYIAEKSSFGVESNLVNPTSWKLSWPQGAEQESIFAVQMMPQLNNFFAKQSNPSISSELNDVMTGTNRDVKFQVSIFLCLVYVALCLFRFAFKDALLGS